MSLLAVKVEGDVAEWLDKKIEGLQGEEFRDTLLDELQAVLLNRIRQRFLATTAPDGSIWIESAAARKRQESGKGGKTGFDTGNLFHSIQAYLPSDGGREIGTDVPYAGYFNFGTQLMPARVFIGVSDDDLALVQLVAIHRVEEFLVSA